MSIGGAWGVDNDGTMSFNGQPPTGTGTFSLTNAAHDNYNVAHPFAITGGFLAGLNTLDRRGHQRRRPGCAERDPADDQRDASRVSRGR